MSDREAGRPRGYNAFRAILRGELPRWEAEGLVTPGQAARLSERYSLDRLGNESWGLLSAVIYSIGALLIGGGVIAFVAAHWDDISRPGRIALLYAGLLGLHAAGGWLWLARGRERLGRALVFAGCLAFGASLGLIAQIFHLAGDGTPLLGLWAAGTLAVAWAAGGIVPGLLALVVSFFWFTETLQPRPWLAAAWPVLAATLVLPLAARVRSRLLWILTLAGAGVAVLVMTGRQAGHPSSMLLAGTAAGLLLWATGKLLGERPLFPGASAPCRALGVGWLSLVAYVWSFHWLWEGQDAFEFPPFPEEGAWLVLLVVAAVAAKGLLVAAFARAPERAARDPVVAGVVLGAFLLGAAAVLGLFAPAELGVFWVWIVNLSALLFAGAAIASGFTAERRVHFWWGTILAVGLVVGRILEYDTGLLVKSAVLVLAGIAVLVIGGAYERWLRGRAGHD